MGNLLEIGNRYGTDKFGKLGYHPFYERHLSPWVDRKFTLMEIGVYKGASIRTWEEHFQKATIVGLDNDPGVLQQKFARAKIVIGEQGDAAFLRKVAEEVGGFDVIIDDGSHMPWDQKASFVELFKRVRPGGLYVIEDLMTSYWPNWKGGPVGSPGTSIAFVKSLLDDVHVAHHGGALVGGAELGGVHIYNGVVFLERG